MQTKQMAHGRWVRARGWGREWGEAEAEMSAAGVIDHRSPVYSSWLTSLANVWLGAWRMWR